MSYLKNTFKKIPLLYYGFYYQLEMIRKRKLFLEILDVVNRLSENGVRFIYFQPPQTESIKNLSGFELKRIADWVFDFNHISDSDAEKLNSLYGNRFSVDYIKSIYDGVVVYDDGGVKQLADYQSKFVNIVSGIRLTKNQPKEFRNRIHLYGACTIRGTGVEDKDTIPSFLQESVNQDDPGSYQVVNHGIGFGSTVVDDLKHIKTTIFHSGDIVILCTIMNNVFRKFCDRHKIMNYECSSLFNRPHPYGEWFTDEVYHTMRVGNRIIADYMFSILKKNCLLSEKVGNITGKGVILEKDERRSFLSGELEQYFCSVRSAVPEDYLSKIVGSIVMNCNPFTLGHRYLIETAAQKVDYLIIFVVEEDKSYFPFQDRYKLVREGTKDLKNVFVVRSGKFIISAATFPGYFNKENLRGATVDTSKDIDLFGRYIAPALNISVRFAGEEPLDPVTDQYNQTMAERLPLYNVKFHVISRLEIGGGVISASRVRKYLEQKNFGEIRKIVPASTYRYLRQKYGENDDSAQM